MAKTLIDTIFIPKNEINFSYARSSGPGGQNVNKVNSKAILHWDIDASTAIKPEAKQRFKDHYANLISKEGFVVISSDEYRDQPRNMDSCLDKLKKLIATILRPPKKRIATKPSRSQKGKRLDAKKKRGAIKSNRQKVDF